MYGKKLMQAATVALCLVSLNALAAQDFPALSTQELTQLKPNEMGEEDRNAFRVERQQHSASMSSTEKEEFRNQMREQKKQEVCREVVAWGGGTDLQFYIDAHREFSAPSWLGKH